LEVVLDITASSIQKGYEENESQHQRGVCQSEQIVVEHGRNGESAKSQNHWHEKLLCQAVYKTMVVEDREVHQLQIYSVVQSEETT